MVSESNENFDLSQEFEIELEGSQTLRLLCYSKNKQNRDDGENMDRVMAKGQIQVLHVLQNVRAHFLSQ